jgi:hypothetical protein
VNKLAASEKKYDQQFKAVFDAILVCPLSSVFRHPPSALNPSIPKFPIPQCLNPKSLLPLPHAQGSLRYAPNTMLFAPHCVFS